MKTWVWPFSLYGRIRGLETRVKALTRQSAQLDAQMRAQAIAETGMAATYMSALTSMTGTSAQRYASQRSAERLTCTCIDCRIDNERV